MNDTTDPRSHAVSVYQGDDGAVEDFPVLKAFQQYIDAEQAKARKRLVGMGIFFCVIMFTVIAVFVALLVTISQRNQSLNDRLIDYAMKERERPAPVVVQPPAAQESAAFVALTSKIEDMQRKLAESERKAEESRRKADEAEKARQAALPKVKTQQELELERLTALIAAQAEQNKQMLKLAEEKAKAEEAKARAEEERLKAEREAKAKVEAEKAEKARKREAELEAYRRKHYPELYEPAEPPRPREPVVEQPRRREPVEQPKVVAPAKKDARKDDKDDAKFARFLKDVDSVVSEARARTYFDEEEDEKEVKPPSQPAQPTNAAPKAAVQTNAAPKVTAPSWRIP